MSYKTTPQLNKIIDEELPGRPQFKQQEVVIGGETFDVYFRDIIPCIRALYGDPEFSSQLVFAPERHYVDKDCTVRSYNEMHTGNWWWSVQVCAKSTRGMYAHLRLGRIPLKK